MWGSLTIIIFLHVSLVRIWRRRSSKRRELREQRQLAASAALDLLSLGPPIQHNEDVSLFTIFLPFFFCFCFCFFVSCLILSILSSLGPSSYLCLNKINKKIELKFFSLSLSLSLSVSFLCNLPLLSWLPVSYS